MSAPATPPAGPSSTPQIQVVNLLPVALAVLAVLLALSFFGRVAAPLLSVVLAIILATALNPLARYLERFMPRGAAGVLTVLLVVGVLGILAALTVPPIASQLGKMSGSLPTDPAEIERRLNEWINQYPAVNRLLTEDAVHRLIVQATAFSAGAAKALPNVVTTLVGGVFTGIVTLAMVAFVLSNPVPLVNAALGAVPPRFRVKATRALAQMLKQLGAWGRATALIMLVTGTFISVGLMLLGVENWLIFGILAALGELVPTIGPIVATLPPILFSLAQDPQKALYVAIFALVFQQLEGFILAPFLLGGAGKLHPLSTIVGVLLFGSVFGLVGAFLTVPFLIVIKAIYQEFYLQDAPDIPDAVAMALISGRVEEQLDREEEARREADRAIQEVRDAELDRQMQEGDLDLEAALQDPAPDASSPQDPPRAAVEERDS